MSTKTAFKRVALVAAAALAIGGVSAVSANATAYAESLSISSTTSSVASSATATTTVTDAFLPSDTAITTDNAFLVSAPAGNTALPVIVTTNAADVSTNASVTGGLTQVATVTTATAGLATAGVFDVSLTATLPGTYVIKVIPTTLGTSASAVTWTVTVSAPAAANATASRVYMQLGGLTATATPGVFTASSTLTSGGYALVPNNATVTPETKAAYLTALAANITSQDANVSNVSSLTYNTVGQSIGASVANLGVIVANGTSLATSTISPAIQDVAGGTYGAIGAYTAAGFPVTVSIAGPGLVEGPNGVIVGKTFTETTSNSGPLSYLQRYFGIVNDGTTGTSTITVSVNGVTLATKTIVFYGAAATIKSITPATSVGVVGANNAALTAVVVDSLGNPVPGVQLHALSDNATVAADAIATTDSTGTATFNLPGTSKGVANFKITNATSLTDTTTTPLSGVGSFKFTVGSATVASYAISLDQATYAPGQVATVSIKMLDASGAPVANVATIAGTLASKYALTVNNFAAAHPVTADGTGTYSFTVNMPLSAASDETITFTPTDTTIAAVSVTAQVSGGAAEDAANAATDAANEATDAANAATDAANAAADSADAATQAAQDAGDKADAALAAVTALSQQVTTLLAKVAALASTIAKIAKKVKA